MHQYWKHQQHQINIRASTCYEWTWNAFIANCYLCMKHSSLYSVYVHMHSFMFIFLFFSLRINCRFDFIFITFLLVRPKRKYMFLEFIFLKILKCVVSWFENTNKNDLEKHLSPTNGISRNKIQTVNLSASFPWLDVMRDFALLLIKIAKLQKYWVSICQM